MKQKESKLMEQKIKIINCLFFKVDQPRWALFSSIRLSWSCSWCMVVNIFFWAFLRLSRSPSGSSSGPSYNWLDVDRQFIWVWLWLSRSPSGPSRFGWLSIKTLTGSNSWVVAARCSNCAVLLDSSPLGMFSQTASSGDAIDINGLTDGGSHHCWTAVDWDMVAIDKDPSHWLAVVSIYCSWDDESFVNDSSCRITIAIKVKIRSFTFKAEGRKS